MKIALLLQTLGKGGAERVASLLSQQFEREGHEVHVLLWEDVRHYPHGGTLMVLNTPATPSLIGKLLNLFKRAWMLRQWHKAHKPDLLISLMETANIPAALSGVPVVVSVHLDPRFELASYQRLLMKWLYPLPNVKARVAVSHGIAKVLETDFGIKDWHVIANPVDLVDIAQQKTLPRLPEVPPLQGDYILGIGRLHPQKGFDLLIDAYADSQLCRVKSLVILGEGDGRAELVAQIAAHGLQDWVLLPGWANNPFPWFAGAWAFVMSSRSEGLGNTLIEAMACGCACIAADCDFGPRDLITDKVNGLLVETESTLALSHAMNHLYHDGDSYTSLKENSVIYARKYDLAYTSLLWLKLT